MDLEMERPRIDPRGPGRGEARAPRPRTAPRHDVTGCPNRPPRSAEQDAESALLRGAQAYLDARRRGGAGPPPEAAWEQFYQAYAPLVRALARGSRGPSHDPHDCVQESWRRLIDQLPKFRYDPDRGRFCSWLAVLVRNTRADLARRRAGREHARLGPEVEDRLVDREADPSASFERRATQVLVREALAELRGQVSPCSYQIFHLHWIDGRTLPEVAAGLGLPLDRVRARHHRLLVKFRELYARRQHAAPADPYEGGEAVSRKRA